MKTVEISVVIPTYNRAATLTKCLEALSRQTVLNPAHEIVIVDDGSTDETESVVRTLRSSLPFELRYFPQTHRGPAAARNIGIRNSTRDILLFLGDDIIATPTLLAQHLARHRIHPGENLGVLGYTTWSPEIEITPVMRWLDHGGPQFAYFLLHDGSEIAWNFFYTSNVSVKRRFLRQHRLFFDEEFAYASYEDTEFAYRLRKDGFVLTYHQAAQAHHFHELGVGDMIAKAAKDGEAGALLVKKAPALSQMIGVTCDASDSGLTRTKVVLRRMVRNQATMRLFTATAKLVPVPAVRNWCYTQLYRYHKMRGMQEALYDREGYH